MFYNQQTETKRGDFMSEKEKQVVEKLKEVIPEMTEFDKGYILGKTEKMAKESKNEDLARKE